MMIFLAVVTILIGYAYTQYRVEKAENETEKYRQLYTKTDSEKASLLFANKELKRELLFEEEDHYRTALELQEAYDTIDFYDVKIRRPRTPDEIIGD